MDDNELLEKRQIIDAIPELPKGSFYLKAAQAGIFPIPEKYRMTPSKNLARLYPADSIDKIKQTLNCKLGHIIKKIEVEQ